LSLLGDVVDAHGGMERWREVREVSARIRTRGLLMAQKLKRRRFDCGLAVRTDRQRSAFNPYPGPGRTGVFDEGSVRIEGDGRHLLAGRDRARDAFFGRPGIARKLWWSDLDALYFAGYAMWNYLNTPFMLTADGFTVEERSEVEVEGERCRGLEVTFPEGFHTHSRRQRFYFDSEGMLRRNDYTAEVVGGFARGAHFSWDHRSVDEIIFPTRRRVVLRGRGDRLLPGPPVVTIELDEISLR
jgi:hypothetical protein